MEAARCEGEVHDRSGGGCAHNSLAERHPQCEVIVTSHWAHAQVTPNMFTVQSSKLNKRYARIVNPTSSIRLTEQ
jgi:hypothetical protein